MSVIEKGWTKRQNIDQSMVQKALLSGYYYSHFNAFQIVKRNERNKE